MDDRSGKPTAFWRHLAVLACLAGCGGDKGTDADVTPPAAVADLAIVRVVQESVDLTWTATGDNRREGTAREYDLRWSSAPITDATWESAVPVPGEPVPAAADTKESLTVTGLSPNQSCHFALKTRDEALNWSALSNDLLVVMPPPVLVTWGRSGSLPGQFQWPQGIEVDRAGVVYVADGGNSRIQAFSADGVWLSSIGRFGEGDPGEFLGARFVAVDSRGHLCVTDTYPMLAGAVDIITPGGEPLAEFVLYGQENYDEVTGIAASPDGFLYVACGAMIVKYAASGAASYDRVASFGGAGTLLKPRGLAVDSDGNIVVADDGLDGIRVFSGEGTLLRQWGRTGSGAGEFREPFDVAVDSSGRIYVMERIRIQVFTATGTYLLQWGRNGNAFGEFIHAGGIAVDPEDCVYVVDLIESRIQKFGPVPLGRGLCRRNCVWPD